MLLSLTVKKTGAGPLRESWGHRGGFTLGKELREIELNGTMKSTRKNS